MGQTSPAVISYDEPAGRPSGLYDTYPKSFRSIATTRSLSALSAPHSATAIATAIPSPSINYTQKARPLGHSLTIHIPGSLTPSSLDKDDLPSPPVFRQPTGVALPLTVVQPSGVNFEPNPMRVDGMEEHQLRKNSSEAQMEAKTDKQGAKDMPVECRTIPMSEPWPSSAMTLVQPTDIKTQSPRRVEKKPASHNLRSASPSSPTVRRSLPCPPVMDNSAATVNNPAPVPSSAWPSPSSNDRLPSQIQSTSSQPPRMHPALYEKHQINGSASNLSIVAGLADAGPYPSNRRTTTNFSPKQAANDVEMARPNGINLAGPDPLQTSRSPGKPGPSRLRTEEVCLECMMRDRDLADVIVQGEGLWERASDADFSELIWREQAVLKSMDDLDYTRSGSRLSGSNGAVGKLFLEDVFHDTTELEDPEVERQKEMEQKKRKAIEARLKEVDWRVIQEVGWRGFRWEEGQEGEGLPRGFRGGHGGQLTEEGIKNLMIKFPSASAYRYSKLQAFLKNQWLLVLEIRATAQKLGHFPFPDDLASTTSLSSHESRIPTGVLPHAVTHNLRMRDQIPIVRSSPSSPANLSLTSQIAPIFDQQPAARRPITQYIPQYEPVTTHKSSDFLSSSRGRHNKIPSSTGLLELNQPPTINSSLHNMDNEDPDHLWTPDNYNQGLRPFSFAVRAGAITAREGSEGHGMGMHGRRSLWGRWGDSVTSLFGGSQGGSGSMIDMHVGLDDERKNTSPSVGYPRAVSLASPRRPSFFSRDSRASSAVDHEQLPRMSRAISHSRLSQFNYSAGEETVSHNEIEKTKGLKGFFKKMKPKRARKNSKTAEISLAQAPLSFTPDTPLVPPPPISVLVDRGDRNHTRNGSGSSSSLFTDGQDSGQSNKRLSGSLLYGTRSVSAPLGNTSSSDVSLGQSVSPSSSKFPTTSGKRDSYASVGKPRSAITGDVGDDRRSTMEILTASNGTMSSGLPDGLLHDELIPTRPGRPHNKTTTSLSASSQTILETPPPMNNGSGSFFSQQQVASGNRASHNGDIGSTLSSNRFKNLPPLPPPGSLEQASSFYNNLTPGLATSPDPFNAAFAEQEHLVTYQNSRSVACKQPVEANVSSPYGSSARFRRGVGSGGIVNGYPQPQHLQPTHHTLGLDYGYRTSLDQRGTQPVAAKQRSVQTMYGTDYLSPDIRLENDSNLEMEKNKRGFKGFFGVNKGGRLA
ncbi:hypothetical protein L204_102090 [Cryptococcus depauperatus]|nr:hypothetical protein L204_04574 [Cryptococcus depauperatus CBS 7855]